MKDKKKYITALEELSKIIGRAGENLLYASSPKITKLGLFIYDSKGEIKAFDRTTVNPLGIIINKKL